MKHASEIELLEYIAGKLAGPQGERLRRHIAQCSDCSARHDQARRTWDILGQWPVDAAPHHVAGRVEALAAREKTPARSATKAPIALRPRIFAALRIAAAVLIAAGAGHLLGRLAGSPSEQTALISADKPQYIAALGFEWSSELTWTVLQENAQTGANQP